MIAAKFGVSAETMLRINKRRIRGIKLKAKLKKGHP
jgi:hypothetical protein